MLVCVHVCDDEPEADNALLLLLITFNMRHAHKRAW